MDSKAVIFLLLVFAGTTYSQGSNSSAPPDVPKITREDVGSDFVVVSWPRTGAWENVEDFDITVNSSDTANVCSSNVTCNNDPCTFNTTQDDSCKISSCTALNITVEGDGSSSEPLGAVTAPPSAENTYVAVGSSKIATCTWTLPTDNVSCLNNTRIIFKSENAEYTYNEAGVIGTKTHSLHACDAGSILCTVQTFGGDGESDIKYSNATFNADEAGSLIGNLTLTPETDMLNTSWDLTTDNCTRLTGYRISWNPGNMEGLEISNTTEEYSIENLTPCTEYNVILQPLTDGQENLAMEKIANETTDLTVLDAPVNVTVDDPMTTSTSLNVSWMPPKPWGQLCNLQNYSVTWSSNGTDAGGEMMVQNGTTEIHLSGLIACTNYTIEVSAGNIEGYGPAGVTASPTRDEVLKSPSNVNINEATNTSITVSWKQDEWGPLCPVLNYSVSWESVDDPNDSGSEVISRTGSDIGLPIPTSFTITDLTPCSNYSIKIKSGNSEGNSTSVTTLGTTLSTVLEAPSNLTVDDKTNNSITVSWAPTELGSNCPLLNFSVSWEANDTSEVAGFQIVNDTENEYTITELTPCTNYTIEVRAGNDIGFGDPIVTTEKTDLVVLKAPSDVTEENVTTDSITVSWSQDEWGPLCLVKNYTVSWDSMERPKDSGSETTTNDVFTIAGLSACTSYNITIKAWNSKGPSEPAIHENRTMAIAPGPPVNVICGNATGPNEFSVSWSEPNKTNCVKSYIVQYTGDVLWSDIEDQNETSTDDPEVNLVGLTPWTIYNVSVAGAIGGGEFGEFESCEMETQEDTPGPPRYLNKTHFDANSITLEWDRPIEENGNLSGYTLTWGSNNYRNFTAYDTMAVIESLDRRTSYNFTLWAITNAGLGQSISVIVSTGGANVAAIVVPIIFGLILLILVFIAYFNRAKLQDYYKNMTEKRSGMKDGRNNTEMSQRERPPPTSPPGPPAIDVEGVKKERLRQFISELEYNSHEGLEEEFNVLKEMSPQHPTDTANEYYNRPKNRFINILPYNDSRVILSEVQGSPGSDYINASYIWDAEGRRSFIAAQGPKVNTTADFWRMVWELNVYYIVMLTNLMEKGRDKCFKYWPDPEEGPVTHGAYSIQNHNEDKAIFSTNRLLEIQSGGHKRTVKHYHFTSWPDFGVPQHEDQLLDFISKIRTNVISSNKPMVVHCSAGVGRTGTFIALWNLMENVDRTPNASEVNINKTILQMRECRPLMVQSQDQYLYLCKCIATYIENPGRWNGRDEVDNSYENAGYGDEGNIYENVYMKS